MKLFVTALNSGSSGNCYYVGNESEAVLIDAGISCREIEQRMKRLELSMKKVKAIFISHEHTDHIRGVRVLSKKYNLPIYLTKGTLINANLDPTNPLLINLVPKMPVKIGSLEIIAFPKIHDARDPQSFIVQCHEVCVGIFTDIGSVCENVSGYMKCCNAVFLEANYDEKMLDSGNYPLFLKNRIKGGKGHLSNREALSLFLNYKSDHLSHVFLSHLSEENNDPLLVYKLFKANSLNTEIVLTSRTSEIPVYTVSHSNYPQELKSSVIGMQQSLFA